jgi:hypothetical protein
MPDLSADKIAAALGAPYPDIPHGYVSFKAYLGEDNNGVHRLFCDDTFLCWMEVKATDIAFRTDIEDNETDARSVLYIKRKAMVTRCEAGYAYELHDADVDPGGSGIKPKHPPWP